MRPSVEVRKGSITTVQVNAIVNPANSFGYMGGGVAGVIKNVGGQMIEDEAVGYAPIQVGDAVVTGAGDLVCQKVIHAPTMHNPGEATDSHKVMCAVEAALALADSQSFSSIAIPGMGTGVGGFSKAEAAKIIVKAIRAKDFHSVERIVLIDIDDEMVAEFKKALKL